MLHIKIGDRVNFKLNKICTMECNMKTIVVGANIEREREPGGCNVLNMYESR